VAHETELDDGSVGRARSESLNHYG
jgi:hypothetical protein